MIKTVFNVNGADLFELLLPTGIVPRAGEYIYTEVYGNQYLVERVEYSLGCCEDDDECDEYHINLYVKQVDML